MTQSFRHTARCFCRLAAALAVALAVSAAPTAGAEAVDNGLTLRSTGGYATRRTPAFMDTPDPALRRIYDFNTDSDTPRDLRLYGELLLQEGNEEGFPYVFRAAKKRDGRAAYLVALAHAHALWGQTQDYSQAIKWLHTSLSAGYPPAYEQMAALSWDGGWDCLRNTHDAIWYLDQAISGYEAGMPASAADRKQLTAYISTLRTLRAALNKTKDYDWELAGRHFPQLNGLLPSYTQMRLATIPDTSGDGLRRRLTYIQDIMEKRRGPYKLGKLADIRLEYMGIRAVQQADTTNLATTTWKATDTDFSAKIDLLLPAMPQAPGYRDPNLEILRKQLFRLVIVNDALAHELAHVYFCSRYPKIADMEGAEALKVYEGHASNVAYEFTNATFFHGKLSPERYADLMLADEYREYFFWFRENRLTQQSRVRWDLLDTQESKAGGAGYRPRTRRQRTAEGPVVPLLRFFGKAFPGYM